MSWYNVNKYSMNQSYVCDKHKWSDNKLCKLVCLYKKFPCLWNKNNPAYMENSIRHSAYSSIHRGLDMPQITFTEVMIKIREIRRTYVNELKKILKANKSGYKYKPRQKWFYNLHNFLYENLDLDEIAELQGCKDSVNSCCHEDDLYADNYSGYDYDDEDDEEDSQYIDTDSLSQSDCNANSSIGSSKIEQCRKTPTQRVLCNSSVQAGSSMMNYYSPSPCSDAKRYPASKKIEPCTLKVKKVHCPMKILECPQQQAIPSSPKICTKKNFQPKQSTSITILCDKKINYQCSSSRDENCQDFKQKNSVPTEKESNNNSRYSSSEKFDSNISLKVSPSEVINDEFDAFAKSVACQLRKMDIESAVIAQNQIQNVLTDQRLHKVQPVRSEISETRSLDENQRSQSSPQQSVTRIRSRLIKPDVSKHRLSDAKTNMKKNENRIDERPSRVGGGSRISQLLLNLTPQRKTKK